MEKEFERITELFKKSLSGHISDGEQAFLDELLRDRHWYSVYHSLKDSTYGSRKIAEYQTYSHEKAFQKFRQQVHKRSFLNYYINIASVAAGVMLAFLLIYVSETSSVDFIEQQLAEANILAPGGKKAQIRLADGSLVKIAGNSMHIQEKQGAQIAYNNGEITYKPDDKVETLVYNELIVPLAGECYVVLDDGTKVWMNADSKLKYPVRFVGNERRVFLEGEAFFEVKKNTKPFIVHTSLGEINVLGTSFDVKAYKDETKVYTTLVTGKVRFSAGETMEINPGEQIVASSSGKLEKRIVDVAEYVGWKEGLYVFKEQALEVIMKNLARWYDIHVFYQNSDVRKIAFTGNLKRYDSINTFMEVLVRTGDVKYKINGNTITLFQ